MAEAAKMVAAVTTEETPAGAAQATHAETVVVGTGGARPEASLSLESSAIIPGRRY